MKIGELARLGQVSVRMLRHYDAIGLLRPARVDQWSGYRYYDPDQLATLHRIVALKALGLTLDQVGRVLGDAPDPAELRGMLLLRRHELAAQLDAAQAHLAEVEHRLHLIEGENAMSTHDYVTKHLPSRRIAARTATVGDDQTIAEVVEPLFDGVSHALRAMGACADIGVATYDTSEGRVHVTSGYDYAGAPGPGFEVIDLPAAHEAVCVVHLGPMNGIGQTWSALHAWIDSQGMEPSGPGREIYVQADRDDQLDWVTEVQQPVQRSGSPDPAAT